MYISIVAGRERYSEHSDRPSEMSVGTLSHTTDTQATSHSHSPRNSQRKQPEAFCVCGCGGVRGQRAKGRRIAGKRQNPIKYSTWQRCENYKANVTFCVCRSLSLLSSFCVENNFSQRMSATVYGAVKYRQHGPQWQQCLGPFGCPISPTTLSSLAALLPPLNFGIFDLPPSFHYFL